MDKAPDWDFVLFVPIAKPKDVPIFFDKPPFNFFVAVFINKGDLLAGVIDRWGTTAVFWRLKVLYRPTDVGR